ncbi:sigma-70 family RNA polymerase sigma factor [Alkalihalobacillus sp. 1P02AB]|uniref:sigma-70 family RNA polymerase sigma factor n=1 Tax=Alkalihalobacillus sp. 1P02AB TaxID=3132260 RepID=UPI0039A61AC4
MLNNEILSHLMAEDKKELIFEMIMDEYGEKLIRLAYGYLKDWGLAEDVVQEVFIKCHHRLESFRMDSSIQTWLYSITSNQCKDVLRSTYFKRMISNISIFKTNPEARTTPELILLEHEKDQQMTNALLTLPVKYREVLILFYYEDASILEISQILRTNENTVKTRLHRGKKLLKKMIEEGPSWKN